MRAFATTAANDPQEARMRVIHPAQAPQFVDTVPTAPGKLTESDLDAAIAHVRPHRRVVAQRCSADACLQGRITCPVPQACERADTAPVPRRRGMTAGEAVAMLAIYVISATSVVALLAWGIQALRGLA